MAKKRGLGTGIDKLIPIDMEGEEKEKIVEKVVERVVEKKVETIVKIVDVAPNKEQPRKIFDEDKLYELADSIKQYGIVQPIVVQKKDDYYQIIAGERRWRAAKMAGLKEIPVIIKDYTNEEVMEIALIENIQREDLNPIEEAMAYKHLLKERNLKQDELAEKVCKSRTAISNTMRLLNLAEEVQSMIIENVISSGHGKALLPIKDEQEQIKLAYRIVDEELTVREIENLVNSIVNPKKKREKEEYQDNFVYENIENQFKDILGNQVTIKRKSKDKGKIEIDYYSTEDLERIMELIKKIKG